MDNWVNHRHPQTLSGAVVLSYLVALNTLLSAGGGLGLIGLAVGAFLVGGAFLTANDRKVGYALMVGGALIMALLSALIIVLTLTDSPSGVFDWINPVMRSLVSGVFPLALFVAAIHPQSRTWVKIYFE